LRNHREKNVVVNENNGKYIADMRLKLRKAVEEMASLFL